MNLSDIPFYKLLTISFSEYCRSVKRKHSDYYVLGTHDMNNYPMSTSKLVEVVVGYDGERGTALVRKSSFPKGLEKLIARIRKEDKYL